MELGIIADEVHTDFATACDRIREWGLPLVETARAELAAAEA